MKECAYCSRCYDDGLRCCPHDGQALVETLPGGCLLDSKYKLENCIGRGGMGAVYRAKHVHLHRPFAIKTILPEFASRDPKAADRFLQEARAAAAIQHPNVVAITDFGATNFGLFYYVMEHIEGMTLRDELHKYGAMSPERVYRIFKQVLAGVSAAHRLHMVHRDLKPSNIMLTKLTSASADDFKLIIPLDDEPASKEKEESYELAKVVDFGLAKFVNDAMAWRTEQSDGRVVGSPLYMSPEQCDGNNVDERSDIYSLGVILYHMLTGEVPFKGDSLPALLTGHLLKEPPQLRSINPDIPEKLEKVVLRALAKKPQQRQQSVAELAEEFEAAMAVCLAPEAKTATLSVQTMPPACEIYIDDEYKGRTGVEGRLVIKGLPAGTHRVRITLTGYMEWRQVFTAPVGESCLQARLERKEDLALMARRNLDPTRNPVAPARRASGPLDSSLLSRKEQESVSDDTSGYLQSPPAISAIDILLATIAVMLVVLLFGISYPVDPISGVLAQRLAFPVEQLVGIFGILSTIGINSSMIIADQMPAYRNSRILSRLFNISSTAFLLTIIIPMAVAIPIRLFSDQADTPTNFWFMARLLAIICCFAVRQRVRARHRVPFLA